MTERLSLSLHFHLTISFGFSVERFFFFFFFFGLCLQSYFHETMGKAVYTRSSLFCHKFDDKWCYTIFDTGIIYGKI